MQPEISFELNAEEDSKLLGTTPYPFVKSQALFPCIGKLHKEKPENREEEIIWHFMNCAMWRLIFGAMGIGDLTFPEPGVMTTPNKRYEYTEHDIWSGTKITTVSFRLPYREKQFYGSKIPSPRTMLQANEPPRWIVFEDKTPDGYRRPSPTMAEMNTWRTGYYLSKPFGDLTVRDLKFSLHLAGL